MIIKKKYICFVFEAVSFFFVQFYRFRVIISCKLTKFSKNCWFIFTSFAIFPIGGTGATTLERLRLLHKRGCSGSVTLLSKLCKIIFKHSFSVSRTRWTRLPAICSRPKFSAAPNPSTGRIPRKRRNSEPEWKRKSERERERSGARVCFFLQNAA